MLIQSVIAASAVVSGWIVAPMALTPMFGKSFVIQILTHFGYSLTLMTNTLIIGFLICCLALPSINRSIYIYLPLIAILGFFNSIRSEEHTSELQSRGHLVCRLLLEKKKHDELYRMRYSILYI